MKIVHIGYNHRANDIRIFQKECISLTKAGNSVTYITSNKNSSIENSGVKNGVNVVILSLKSTKNRIQRLCGYLKELKKTLINMDADIYHFHEFELLPVLTFLLKNNKKVIYDMHEDTPRQIEPMIYKKFGSIAGKFIVYMVERYENHCISKCDYVIAATPHIADRCRKHNKNTTVIANYPIISKEKEEDSCKTCVSFQNPKEHDLDSINLCYCGGMSEARNISMYVKAMENIPGKLFLIGELSTEYKKRLEKINAWKNVVYFGYVNNEEVRNIYQKSDIGLCVLKKTPNHYYSLPIKLFEYMEAGLPVICSDFPLWRKIVEENNCGVCVDPDNKEEFIEAVTFLRNNPILAHKMGTNGKKIIYEKYNWGHERERLINLYESI